MPYIVTTRTEDERLAGPYDTTSERVAVATLGQARDHAALIVGDRRAADPSETVETLELASPAWDDHCTAAQTLSAEGGTVGPLPDGTTITVEPLLWSEYRDLVIPRAETADQLHASIADAWNEKHGTKAAV